MSKRIVAVLGDFYHSEELAIQSFKLAIEQIDTVEIEYKKVDQLLESLKTNPDAVVLFAENRLNPEDQQVETWMDDEAAKAIRQYVEKGGGWLAWHSGFASYENFEDYVGMLRGYFEYHPVDHQVVTYYSDQDSPLISKGDQFSFLDEHYFVHCDEANTNVFLRSESVDGSSIAGWEHSFGKGHVICLAPAHRKEGLLHPMVIDLLVKSIKLSCQIEHP